MGISGLERAGLARFDGLRFQVFDRSTTPALVSDNCLALARDQEGVLWIGTRNGLVRYKDRGFTRYTTEDGLCDNGIWWLCASRDGGVWIATDRGLGYWRDGKSLNYHPHTGRAEDYEERESARVDKVHEDAAGRVWIIHSNNLEQFDPAANNVVRVLARGWINHLNSDSAGHLWWEIKMGHRWRDGEKVTYRTEDDCATIGWSRFTRPDVGPGSRRARVVHSTVTDGSVNFAFGSRSDGTHPLPSGR